MTIAASLRSALLSGLRSGLNPSKGSAPVDPYAGVTKDATANVYLPASSSEWSTFRTAGSLAAATPNGLWNINEASGNLSDAIGALTLTAAGAPSYQQSVSGWSKKGIAIADADSTTRFVAAAGVGPSPATTSQLWLWLVKTPSATPAAARDICGLYGATPSVLRVLNTSRFARYLSDGVSVDGSVAFDGTVHPLVVRYDRTNSRTVAYTKSEKLTGTYAGTSTDGNKGFGDGPATAAGCTYLYGAMWSGAAAEMSDANLKALLTTMGFTIGWT